MKKLPIGIQTFRKMHEGNHCYADKTPLIAKLADSGGAYFLSRPRRFGKSLLIDTLAEAFLGNQDLFSGLWLENNWDWEHKHPVVKLDFSGGVLQTADSLELTLLARLKENADGYGLTLENEGVHLRLHELIAKLHEATGERVVVLIDEYDKPILDNLEKPEIAVQMREGLRNFYSVLKGQDAHLRFVMLTGVSKFSKVSLFSGLNNLNDITLDPRYATLCGYTQSELETVFSEHLDGVDLDEVRHWYNGYNFLGESVYNPFDVLLYLDRKIFRSYWFETGTPTFLIDMIRERGYAMPQIHEMRIAEETLGIFDVDQIALEALLFQTGYLTIQSHRQGPGGLLDTLGYPNHEVAHSLPHAFLNAHTPSAQPIGRLSETLFNALEQNRPERLESAFHAFFAAIPHNWYRKNKLSEYEGYYASLVYCAFASLGVKVIPEDVTNRGNIDLTVCWQNVVFVLEFKMVEPGSPTGSALVQIRERCYAEKYQAPETSVSLIGMEFDQKKRNLCGFEYEKSKEVTNDQ